jgi:type II secretory pathway pseudopilin PulG
MHAPRYSRGFSLLELVVCVMGILIVTGAVLDRVLPLIGRAQRAAFMQVQGELRSSLLLTAAERITQGETAKIAELATTNPMSLLPHPPANYLGVRSAPNEADIPRASWYFDEQSGRLAYRVGRHTRFAAHEGPRDRIELRVALTYEDRDADGSFDAARDRFDGVRLESVHAYEWPD